MNLKYSIQSSIVFTALAAAAMNCPGPLSAATFGDPAGFITIPPGYWQGELVAPGRSWELALDVDPTRADTGLLDMPSIWRIGLPLESLEQRGDSLFFDLPWGMGRVRARVDGGRIDGLALLSNGDTGVLQLQRSTVAAVHSRDLDFQSDSITIGATVFLPASAGPHPAAVILHGGGDSSREESPPYRFWGPYLARRGYVVLLYDKRGNGDSGGDWRTVGFEERAADVLAGIDALRRLAEVDTAKIGLIGVSQGSWVAGLVARDDPGLCFVVNISGPAVSVREADTAALRFELVRDGWAPRDVGERLALWQMMVDYTRSNSDDRLWERLVAAEIWAGARAWSEVAAFRIGERGSWWKQWYGRVADYDPLPVLTDTDVPMLWMYGERDSQSDVARNVAALEQLRLEASKDYTIAVFPAAGHGLLVPVSERGFDLEPLTTAPGFFHTLLGWIGSQTAD